MSRDDIEGVKKFYLQAGFKRNRGFERMTRTLTELKLLG